MSSAYSLVPRPSLTAFFAAVEKSVGFFHGCEGRPGYEAIISMFGIGHSDFFI